MSKGTDDKYRVLYKDLVGPARPSRVEIVDNFHDEWTFIDNVGPVFFFKTDRDAPQGRVIAYRRRPSKKPITEAKTIIAEAAETLQGVNLVGDHFFATYLKDAKTEVKVHDLQGKFVRDVKFPGIGTASGFGGKREDKETFYSFTSFTAPTTIYRYDVATARIHRLQEAEGRRSTPTDYETKQVFYTSKDGTKVPDVPLAQEGAEARRQEPDAAVRLRRVQHLAHARRSARRTWSGWRWAACTPCRTCRGGGEYGEDWHKAGTKLKKQNVFDDFIAAAEWLIEHKITSTPKLAISGGSNGGLLVGACMTQRPELFGAALPAVGVMDMLRFHKFTIGHAWVDDYGSRDHPEEFQALLQVFAPAQPQAGDVLPADDGHHGRPRRPRGPGPLVQVRRHLAGGAVVRQPRADPHRDQGRPRRGQAHGQDHRGGGRPLGVPRQVAGDRGESLIELRESPPTLPILRGPLRSSRLS